MLDSGYGYGMRDAGYGMRDSLTIDYSPLTISLKTYIWSFAYKFHLVSGLYLEILAG